MELMIWLFYELNSSSSSPIAPSSSDWGLVQHRRRLRIMSSRSLCGLTTWIDSLNDSTVTAWIIIWLVNFFVPFPLWSNLIRRIRTWMTVPEEEDDSLSNGWSPPANKSLNKHLPSSERKQVTIEDSLYDTPLVSWGYEIQLGFGQPDEVSPIISLASLWADPLNENQWTNNNKKPCWMEANDVRWYPT